MPLHLQMPFLGLSNQWSLSARLPNAMLGIHRANASAREDDQSALCVRVSRVNPSWRAAAGCLRICALRGTTIVEEHTSYEGHVWEQKKR
ncbi:hypothetical protein A0H81_14847 [Grifola frondosa]|uniref:Uncharacterized protein n=1 Tax=Grifola frondosa TaxID=5627 RepID=A0A1C7LLW5_GRIFR|nr:hypothetical protein A0H81_14847 [Grifola frondosa]